MYYSWHTYYTAYYMFLDLVYFVWFLSILVQSEAYRKHLYNFELVYEWKQIEYTYSSENERSEAIANGSFHVGKVQPVDTQYTIDHHTGKERIFITTPRLGAGVPVTLGIITDDDRDGNPIIAPYPSWSWQLNPEKCNKQRLVSVFRVWVDECNRLWVVDNGVIGNNHICAPQILTFDLKTDTLLYKYEIPYHQYKNISWFLTPTVEVENTRPECQNSWVYVADPTTPSLLVYSLKQNKSWVVQDRSFEHDPKYYNYIIGGDSFITKDGLEAVALSPSADGPEKRKLRYHAMSNIRESWVYVKHLKNPDNFKVPNGSPHLFNTYRNRRSQQSATEATDREGNLYFSLLIDVEFAKWDPKTTFSQNNFDIIANDKETMQSPTGVKVTPCKDGKEALWLFSTAFQRWSTGNLNPNETNFRLFVTKL